MLRSQLGAGVARGWDPTARADDVLQALLIASGPGGLIAPRHPHDGVLIHCSEVEVFLVELVRHPFIQDVPTGRGRGHVDGREVERLAATFRRIDILVRAGVVTTNEQDDDFCGDDDYGDDENRPTIYRAPALLRGAVASLRGARDTGNPGHEGREQGG